MSDDTKPTNPFESWPIFVARSGGAEFIRRDDPILGQIAPRFPAWTTPELVWSNFSANPAIRVAESVTMVQSNGRPKVVLTYDLATADNLRLRPGWRGRKERRGNSK